MSEKEEMAAYFQKNPEQRKTALEEKRAEESALLLRAAEEFLADYVKLPEHTRLPIALWILATYVFHVFDVFGYLAVVSPTPRCGKSRLLKVLKLLSSNPWLCANMSEAALFRGIHSKKPTLLIDEAEAIRNPKSDRSQMLLSILNTGYEQGATVPRCAGESNKLQEFEVYCPKVFAAIGRLPETLVDRSIPINMQRRRKMDRLERFTVRLVKRRAEKLQEAIARRVKEERKDITDAYASMGDLDFLEDREEDIWRPLFAMCAVFASQRLPELKERALALSGEKAEQITEDSLSVRLLTDILQVWPDSEEKVSSEMLAARLQDLPESPWRKEVELTPRKLSRMLKPFGISSKVVRMGDSTPRGYVRAEFISASSPYVAFNSQHPQHAFVSSELDAKNDSQQGGCVADRKCHLNTCDFNDVADVANWKAQEGGCANSEGGKSDVQGNSREGAGGASGDIETGSGSKGRGNSR